MDSEVAIENEEQFWDELDDIVSTPCHTHDRIDDTLRTWIELCTKHREAYLQSEDNLDSCSRLLIESSLFEKNGEYVRTQLVYGLLQEDETCTVHLIASFLLNDGQQHKQAFEMMESEGAFSRLVELIREGLDDEQGLHRLLIELLYEMSKTQRISVNELASIDDDFVIYLFGIIEQLASDVNDPYHAPVIRVLLVLNEQYMLSSIAPDSQSNLTNRVVKTISIHGRSYKTFGENLILLLNRESEPALQLLILKLLYLLFKTPSTQEYFYTNDLHVLVDILIRNLLDLPDDSVNSEADGGPAVISLRHTYLRVLHPLIANTQLRNPPNYKRDQLRRALFVLANVGHTHFEQPDETTIRLVSRCLLVEWIRDKEDEMLINKVEDNGKDDDNDHIKETVVESGEDSPDRAEAAGQAIIAKKLAGMDLKDGRESSLSVNVLAEAKAKRPALPAPRRTKLKGVKKSESSM